MKASASGGNRPLEPVLWLGALIAATLVGVTLRPLAFVALLPWSLLVWPLHRRRSRDRRDWPPELGMEIWQTALGFALLGLAVSIAARVTQHEFFGMLFVPVSLLATGTAGVAILLLSFRAVQGSWEDPGGARPGDGD